MPCMWTHTLVPLCCRQDCGFYTAKKTEREKEEEKVDGSVIHVAASWFSHSSCKLASLHHTCCDELVVVLSTQHMMCDFSRSRFPTAPGVGRVGVLVVPKWRFYIFPLLKLFSCQPNEVKRQSCQCGSVSRWYFPPLQTLQQHQLRLSDKKWTEANQNKH